MLDVRTVNLQGHQLVYSKLKRAGGAVEYALVFSVKEEGNSRKLYSLWNLADYPPGDYMNFQVWGSSMGQVSTIVNNILSTMTAEKPLEAHKAENILPTVFIQTGNYSKGKLHLNVVNKARANWMQFEGNYKRTEQSNEENLTTILPLSGAWEEEVIIDTGYLFDVGLSIIAENSYQHDAMYLADGPWGVDMNTAVDAVANFEISGQEQSALQFGAHIVERGVAASGQVKETINVFRSLLGGDQQLDVTAYNFLELNLQNSRTVEISLVTDATDQWEDRLRLTVAANNTENLQSLALADFKNGSGKTVTFSRLKTIVFSVQGDYQNYTAFNLKVNEMRLSKDAYSAPVEEVAQLTEAIPETNFVMNYPNPVENYTVITFPEAADKVGVTISSLAGQTVYHQKKSTAGNKYAVGLQLSHLAPGLYGYTVTNLKTGKTYTGKLIKK